MSDWLLAAGSGITLSCQGQQHLIWGIMFLLPKLIKVTYLVAI